MMRWTVMQHSSSWAEMQVSQSEIYGQIVTFSLICRWKMIPLLMFQVYVKWCRFKYHIPLV